MTDIEQATVVTVEPSGPCHVSPELKSQWRNGPHWHAVWPPERGNHWCYPTREAAEERAAEVNAIWATAKTDGT